MGLDTQVQVNFEFPAKKRQGNAHSDDSADFEPDAESLLKDIWFSSWD